MPSTYTQNLGLEKPATGEQAGTWGDTANNDYNFIDMGIDGNKAIPLSSSSYGLNTAQGAASEGRNKVILWTGTLAGAATVNITPNTAQKLYIMQNQTAVPGTGFAISFQQGTGGAFVLEAGYSAMIYCNGVGNTAKVDAALLNPQFASVLMTGNLTVRGTAGFAQTVTYTGATFFNQAATFNNAVTINTGAPAAWDIYYRSAAGPLAPLAVGQVGQVLQVAAGRTVAWATVQLAVGASIVGSVPNAVYYSDVNNTFRQFTQININGAGLGVGNVPSHSLQVGPGLNPEIWLDTNDSVNRQRALVWSSNLVARWYLLTPGGADGGESGVGNTGSNLAFLSCNDAGAGIHWTMYFARASGNVTIGGAGDQGARLSVLADNPAQWAMVVRGSGTHVQVWENPGGGVLAYINAAGQMNTTGYMINGQPISTGQLQTPWLSTIDAAGNDLVNCHVLRGNQNGGAACIAATNGGVGVPVNLGVVFRVETSGGTTQLYAFVRDVAGTQHTILIGSAP